MAVSVVMPALEMAQETGKVLAWLKKEGDNVAKGEPLLEIETDKVSFELEAQADGILAGVRIARRRRGAGRPDHRLAGRAGRAAASSKSDTASRGMAEQARPMTAASTSVCRQHLPQRRERRRADPEFRPKPAGSPKEEVSTSPRVAEPVRTGRSLAKTS